MRCTRFAATILALWACVSAFGGQCESNYTDAGSMFRGKTYSTFADYPGLEPLVALKRLAAQLPAEGIEVTATDEATGTITAATAVSKDRSASVEVKAFAIDSGTRVQFSISFPKGVMGNAATRAAICRFVDLARVDPETRYRHALVSFVRSNQQAADKVSVVESSTKKRLAKVAGGMLLGALAGAAHAKLTGGDVAKDAAIGAVAGGAIAWGITRIQDKRLADRAQVMLAEAYEPSQGYRAGVREITVSPEVVKAGAKIKVVTRYWALAPYETETFGVYRYAGISLSGAYLRGFRFNPEPFSFGGGGEYQTTLEIELPAEVAPGPYNIHWVVDGQSTGGDVVATFTVTG